MGTAVGKGQVFYRGAGRKRGPTGQRRLDSVCAAAAGHHIAHVVDNKSVVAAISDHRVGTGATVDPVAAAVASDGVVERVSKAVDRGQQRQILHVVR